MLSSYTVHFEYNIIHIVDLSGAEKKARRSVTNDIENIIKEEIESSPELNANNYRYFLYGTDNIISEFDYQTKDFRYIEPDDENISEICKGIMNTVYSFPELTE